MTVTEDKCNCGVNEDSYYRISGTTTNEEIIDAIINRANHLESLIKKYEAKNDL